MWLWDCARAWAGQASGSDVDAAGRELKDQNVISGSLGGEHALLSTFVCWFFFCLFAFTGDYRIGQFICPIQHPIVLMCPGQKRNMY